MTQPAVPQKATFWSNMVEWAGYLKSWFAANNHPANDTGLALSYYDGEFVAYTLKDHDSNNATWDAWIQDEFDAYATYYVIPNNGGTQGFRKFTDGLLEDVLRNTSRKASALNSINLILANSAYQNSDGGDPLATQEFSREVAYALMAFINASRAGVTLNSTQIARRDYLFGLALGHINAWVNNTGTYCRPFMAALTTKALIWYFLYVNGDSRIVPAVKSIADYIWGACWKSAAGAWGQGSSFLYTDRVLPNNIEPQDGFTQPDLNMLIAPMFGFVWWQTGIQTYRDRGDLVFQGGISVYSGASYVSGAYLGTRSSANPAGKQYDQQLYWGKKYIDWAETDPVSGPITPPPPPPPPPPGGGTPPPPSPGDPGAGSLQGVPFVPFGQATFSGAKGSLIIPKTISWASGEENQVKPIFQAQPGAYCAVIGCLYCCSVAHQLTFSTQAIPLAFLDMLAGAGLGKDITPQALMLLSNKSGDISVKSNVAMGPILFYVIEFTSLRFQ